MLNKLFNILFPESCPICNRPSSEHNTAPLCPACWQSIKPYHGPACRKCSKPLISDESIECGECIKDEPAFASARFFGLYDGALRKAINLFKYHRIRRLSKPLSEITAHLKIPPVDAVVPVPLHERRLRRREYNQSALLSRNISERIGAELFVHCLIKVQDTKPQVGLSSPERRGNIRKAFETENETMIRGKSILLIDDVITTGTTVRECSRVLKKAGAGSIHVLALAHGIRD